MHRKTKHPKEFKEKQPCFFMRNQWPTIKKIPDSEWIDFRAAVAKAKGRVIVVVHPFYGDNQLKQDNEKYAKYRQNVLRLLQESKTPVVVLEEVSKMRQIEEKIGKRENVWVLPTEIGGPGLITDIESSREHIVDYTGITLARRLKNAGVKLALVAGMYAHKNGTDSAVRNHEEKWLPKNRKPQGASWTACAGSIYQGLIHSNLIPKVRMVPNGIYREIPKYYLKPTRPATWKRILRITKRKGLKRLLRV